MSIDVVRSSPDFGNEDLLEQTSTSRQGREDTLSQSEVNPEAVLAAQDAARVYNRRMLTDRDFRTQQISERLERELFQVPPSVMDREIREEFRQQDMEIQRRVTGRELEQQIVKRDQLPELTDGRKITLIGIDVEEIGNESNSQMPEFRVNRWNINTGIVEFDVQPTLTESGSVSYVSIDEIRQPASALIYMGSYSREFSLNAKFISRTEEEATLNWRNVQLLKSWRLPEAEPNEGKLSTTVPSRLILSGFSKTLDEIFVRMSSINIEYPDNTDYIKTKDGKDVPIVWPVSISLKEARSFQEFREFSISNFRAGRLGNW